MHTRIPFVRRERDRHGRFRLYFQASRRARKVRIREAEGTPEFFAAYNRLLQSAPVEVPATRGPIAGTWRWLCVEYLKSAAFKSLDERFQRTRRGILEHTFDEPVHPGARETFAAFPVERLTLKALKVLRDRKGKALPEAANNRVKAIRAVFKWAMAEELDELAHVTVNPARDLEQIKTASAGWHSWEVDEVHRFEERHPIGSKARLALALLLYTGVRRSDVVLLGRQHARAGWLKFTARKNANRRPVTVEIPILPELQRVVDASPTGDLTFLVNEFGQPFTVAGFGNWFRDRCVEAGVPGRAHGLRKAAAALAAENGATSQQLMAIFGWLTLAEAERYTRAAKRRKMAGDAMGLLVRNGG